VAKHLIKTNNKCARSVESCKPAKESLHVLSSKFQVFNLFSAKTVKGRNAQLKSVPGSDKTDEGLKRQRQRQRQRQALALGHYNIGWVRCRSTAAKIAKANMADVAWNLFLL